MEPAGAWTTPLTFPLFAKNTNADPSEDAHYLLYDRQINAAQNERFYHVVRQIRTYAGVEKESTVSVDFNPDYESLVFNWIKIWRGTNSSDRLNRDKIKIIQREPELADLLISGHQSAVTVLDDVRPGDIVDFAYSLRGANPVLSGNFFDFVPVQLREPVDHLRTRLLWPLHRLLYSTNHLCSVKPVTIRRPDAFELIWDFKQVPAVSLEDSLPAWYDPDPYVQLTEFPSWTAVNQWALKLFQDTTPLSPALKQKIEEWRRMGRWEDRVLSVLQFVQNDIRYFGIEIGANANRPYPATQVFDRRFGDCKDKTFLFVTILRALGVEAYPVLVNTSARHALDDWLPSGQAFDHAIAFIRFEGRSFWLDCTARQIGTLDNYQPPDFERGLVVHPTTTHLTVIPSGSGSKTTVSEYFQLRGRTQSAELKVVTVAEGRDADAWRYHFASHSRDDIAKQYLHYYSRYYSGIRMSDKIDFQDNEQQNRITMTEFYTIDNAWEKSDKATEYTFSFYPVMFYPATTLPVDKERKMPLAVDFPSHLIQHTEVILPDVWPASRDDKTISGPSFTFHKDIHSVGRTLEMDYEYEALADFVSPGDVPTYLDRLTSVSKSLGYELEWLY